MTQLLQNPTGQKIRNDSAGGGYFGALRGRRKHNGVDFVCTPGQEILSPITGIFVRESLPYSDNEFYSGAYIIGTSASVKLWYFAPKKELVGARVRQGQVIGHAQNIAEHYPDSGMTPHVHLKVERVDPQLLMV